MSESGKKRENEILISRVFIYSKNERILIGSERSKR